MTAWENKQAFKEHIKDWADKLDVQIGSITLRPMKNKWASCSTNGVFTFDTELLHHDKDVGEYVIVHELLHFKIPNHGKLWKSLMKVYLGDYEQLENKLKKIVQKKLYDT